LAANDNNRSSNSASFPYTPGVACRRSSPNCLTGNWLIQSVSGTVQGGIHHPSIEKEPQR